jgi:hypothetical protein
LAVFGTPFLFTWAEYIDKIESSFLNSKTPKQLNKNNTNTYWSCYSTTIGSVLHEMAHVFDLGHEMTGIMHRGFDDFYTFTSTNHFNECSCYSSHKLDDQMINDDIKSITKYENQIKTNFKLIHKVQHYAQFKNENKSELVFNLTCEESRQFKRNKNMSNLSNNTDNKNHTNECTCKRKCYFTESNLVFLDNHKWFNDIHLNDDDTSFSINLINNYTLNLKSKYKLAMYELRTLRFSVVFDYFLFNPASDFELEEKADEEESSSQSLTTTVHFKRNVFYTFDFNLKAIKLKVDALNSSESIHNETLKFNSDSNRREESEYNFEFVTIDIEGNILKTKV